MSINDNKSNNIQDIKYIESLSFEDRKKKSSVLLTKYPDKIPVILEKSKKDKYLPKNNKTKLLIAHNMTVSNILTLLKNNTNINSTTSIYIMVSDKNIMLSGSQSIVEIYNNYKNTDGFLYLEY